MAESIYKTKKGEQLLQELYEQQIAGLGVDYEDKFVETRFGRTHILITGKTKGVPILLFHGGNSTAAYSLKQNLHLLENHLVLAVDTIGHPGKSDQKVLSSTNLDYGKWASDVIDSLGYEQIYCFGESFGGGIVAKLMCVAPQKISKAVLLVPAGIYNASKATLVFSMGIPMMMYLATKNEKWFKRAFQPMATPGEPIDQSTLEMIRISFHHVKINPNMPSPVKKEKILNYEAPTLLLAGEKDALFPGRKVIEKAKELIPQAKTCLLENCGHLYFTSEKRKMHIKNLVNEFLNTD